MEHAGFEREPAELIARDLLEKAMSSPERIITEEQIRGIVKFAAREYDVMITDVMEDTLADSIPEIIEWAALLLFAAEEQTHSKQD